MICFVDISTEFRGGQRGSGTAEVTIWTEKGGQRHEAGPFHVELEDGTRNRLAIMAVNEGLKHFIRPGQDIVIRMAETYVRANIQYLDAWHEKDYRKAGGQAVANADEWRKLWMMKQNQNITVEVVSDAAL